jgi:putative NADH-flavin reductase
MKITILGPTGFVGKVLLEKALDKGYEVKILVRNPDRFGIYKDKVNYIEGSIFQTDKLEECFDGTEAVLLTVIHLIRKTAERIETVEI